MIPAAECDAAAPLPEAAGVALLDAILGAASGDPVAVAVSGGPDSTALLHLADRWARYRTAPLLVLTVDHGLRPESGDEAAAVGALARRLGCSHRILRWDGAKPATGLQAAARDARLSLLTQACHDAGVATLLLAHHRDDQAETLLHRIDRDTGPEGLAAMAAEGWWDGIRLVRPLLSVPKDRLIATCKAAGLAFAEDPSNADPRFARVRLRHLRPELDAAGLTTDRLCRLATAMGKARAATGKLVGQWLVNHGQVHPCGTVVIGRDPLAHTPPALKAAILRTVLRIAGGRGYPPGTQALDGLVDWLLATGEDGRRTLSGCLIEKRRGTVSIFRELAACAPARTLDAKQTAGWDGRFLVSNRSDRPVRIGACGPDGWRRIKRLGLDRALPASARTVPHAARLAWPIVADLDGVVALPHLVLGERRASSQEFSGVEIHLLATRERRFDRPLANGRLTT